MLDAEKNSPAILKILDLLGAGYATININNWDVNKIPQCGFYVLWFLQEKTNEIPNIMFPVYVGATSQYIGERIKQHIDSGVLVNFSFGLNTIDNYRIRPRGSYAFVTYLPVSPSVAFFLEAIFLEEFDFFFNVKQNRGRRKLDYVVGMTDDKEIFLNVESGVNVSNFISTQKEVVCDFSNVLENNIEEFNELINSLILMSERYSVELNNRMS